MDYEFKKNTLDGSYHANFSMGHEAMGRWLTEEVGKNFALMDEVVSQLGALKNSTREWRRIGEELTLSLQENEALIQANYLFSEDDTELEENMDFYDEEAVAICGFEDFEQVLQAWRAFVTRF
ncbi:YacL family protein [Photobacterium ganghwense]|uniref:YacL family protein n=1 Tax=Photobacterium ganghwense TaxID=320778 RepID=UPI004057A9DB